MNTMRPALAATLLVALLSSSGQAGISIGGSLTHEKAAGIGDTYEGSIAIVNSDPEVLEVKVYQTDYLFFSDGTSFYGSPGTTPRSNADWIRFSPHRLAVPPGGSSNIRYEVTVPADDGLVGTYWSLVMVERIDRASPEASRRDDGQVRLGIRQVIRYGVQIITHIGDTGDRNLTFVRTDLARVGGARLLRIDIENTGQCWLRPSVWAELYDTEGRSAGTFEGGRLRIYPGTSVRFDVDLSEVPAGQYKAVIVADCGADDVFGATHSITLKDETYTAAR